MSLLVSLHHSFATKQISQPTSPSLCFYNTLILKVFKFHLLPSSSKWVVTNGAYDPRGSPVVCNKISPFSLWQTAWLEGWEEWRHGQTSRHRQTAVQAGGEMGKFFTQPNVDSCTAPADQLLYWSVGVVVSTTPHSSKFSQNCELKYQDILSLKEGS